MWGICFSLKANPHGMKASDSGTLLAHGTGVTVREEGFIGRSEAAYGNAENWEKVLGWLDGYLSKK
jgi:hypothetical protein